MPQCRKKAKLIILLYHDCGASKVVLMVKNPLANAGNKTDVGRIPGSGRSPGGGNGNPLQYSCLEKSHGQRSLEAALPGVAKSRTRLSD